MTTLNDEAVNPDGSADSAIDALLNRWKDDAAKPSDPTADKTPTNTKKPAPDEKSQHQEAFDDDDALEDASEDDEGGDEDASEDDADEQDQEQVNEDGDDSGKEGSESDAPVAEDNHKVKITVDGETKLVTVKELKRLFGQEASLTRKSQEVANARKVAEQEVERYMVAAQTLINKAEKRFEPFANVDWLVAQQQLSPHEFAALREEARDAYNDLNFLRNETTTVLQGVQQAQQTRQLEAAKSAIAVLEKDVPGWSRELYDSIRTFAVTSGMSPQEVNSIVDPTAIKLIHDAMRYREMKSKAATKKTTTPTAAPKKVVAASKKTAGNMGTKTKAEAATQALRRSGKTDDAVAALMARWDDSDGG